ncbi:hypothetical protein Tco_0535214 [Tanacetum coccineum]
MLQSLWGIVTCNNVDFVGLIWEDFKYQIESKKTSKQKKELLPFSRFTKLIIKYILSQNDQISNRPHSGNMSLSLMKPLAKSKGSKLVKTRGKGLFTKKGVEVAVERVNIHKRRRSKIVVEEVGQSKEVADEVDSGETKEDDEEPLVKRRTTGVDIGRESYRESEKESLDHSKKLKGMEILSEATQFKIDLKKDKRANRNVFILQQRLRDSCEESSVTLEVPDELTRKSSNEGAGVTLEVPDDPSDNSSSSSSDSEEVVEDISSNEADDTMKADEVKKPDIEKDTKEQIAKEHVAKKQAEEEEHEKPEATLISSTHTLSFAEFINQYLNETTEKSKKPESQFDNDELDSRVTRLEKTITAMSRFNLPEAIVKSVKDHLKNVLHKDVPDFGKIKLEKSAKQSMPKYSTTLFDQAALGELIRRTSCSR